MPDPDQYTYFKITDTDGKAYSCSRRILQDHNRLTQIITVFGINSTQDPIIYDPRSSSDQVMEHAAKQVALKIINQYL